MKHQRISYHPVSESVERKEVSVDVPLGELILIESKRTRSGPQLILGV